MTVYVITECYSSDEGEERVIPIGVMSTKAKAIDYCKSRNKLKTPFNYKWHELKVDELENATNGKNFYS